MKIYRWTVILGAALLAAGPLFGAANDAAPKSGATNDVVLLRLPPAGKKPVIDGVMDPGEWDGASHQFGGISSQNENLAFRWADFWFGYDDENLYFAQRSKLPPKTMTLRPNNQVELKLRIPGAPEQSIIFNSKGEGTFPEGTRIANGMIPKFWISEVSVPLKALGIKAIPYGQECGLQMIRRFVDPKEEASWQKRSPQTPYGIWIPEKEIPTVNFTGFWTHLGRPGISCTPALMVLNRTKKSFETECRFTVESEEVPLLRKEAARLAPGAAQKFNIRGIWSLGVERRFRVEVCDSKTQKVFYRRSFAFHGKGSVAWRDSDPPYQLLIAVYPSYQKLRFQLTCADGKKLKQVADPVFFLADAKGAKLRDLNAQKRKSGLWTYDGALPELPEGNYQIMAEFKNGKGETEKLSDRFEIRKFPWAGLNLGAERIIIPPFKPLQSKEGVVKALQTGFKESGNGFWEAIYALDENILAKPVEFVIDGKPFETVAVREIETSPDLVIRETDLRYRELKLTVRREYEQDGFCKVTLKFDSENPFRVQTLDLNFPMKKELAKYFFSAASSTRNNPRGAIPDKPGTTPDSMWSKKPRHPSFKGFSPYVWFGEYRKGLVYVAEKPFQWGRKNNTPSQEITVDEDGAVRLRLHLAAAPRTFRKGDVVELAFQPTPVKPLPPGWREYFVHGSYHYNNNLSEEALRRGTVPAGARGLFVPAWPWGLFLRTEKDWWYPPNGDWSFYDLATGKKWRDNAELTAFIRDYFRRNKLDPHVYSAKNPYSWTANCPMENYMVAAAQRLRQADFWVLYGNARMISRDWPEFAMYTDEWNMGNWRNWSGGAYSADPVPSYIDYNLYNLRKFLRRGLPGYYYDNIYVITATDPVTSGAEETAQGVINPAFGILALRDLVKRTAVVLHQEKKYFCGYPALMLHMTDCPLVPVLSFAGMQLDWEMAFGGGFYQKRFPLEYGVTTSTGEQAGVCPAVLVNLEGENEREKVLRSAVAMCLLYNLIPSPQRLAEAPQWYLQLFDRTYAFGYGKADTVVFPALASENPVRVTPDRVKATVVKRADGAVLLQIGNLGKEAQAEFDLQGLAKGEATDLMTGRKLGSGGRFKLKIADHDFALVEVRP